MKQILLLLAAGSVSCGLDPVLPPYLSVRKDTIRKKMQLSLNLGMLERDKHTEDLGTCNPNIVFPDNRKGTCTCACVSALSESELLLDDFNGSSVNQ